MHDFESHFPCDGRRRGGGTRSLMRSVGLYSALGLCAWSGWGRETFVCSRGATVGECISEAHEGDGLGLGLCCGKVRRGNTLGGVSADAAGVSAASA